LKSHILQFNKFIALNELSGSDLTAEYAKLINKTYDYPWREYLSSDEEKMNPKSVGKIQKQTNTIANARFTRRFYDEFPIGDTVVETNYGPCTFVAIKFNTNATNYSLIFESESGYHVWIKPENKSFYVRCTEPDLEISEESVPLIMEMLKYNYI
jgi:hypothetical protein